MGVNYPLPPGTRTHPVQGGYSSNRGCRGDGRGGGGGVWNKVNQQMLTEKRIQAFEKHRFREHE